MQNHDKMPRGLRYDVCCDVVDKTNHFTEKEKDKKYRACVMYVRGFLEREKIQHNRQDKIRKGIRMTFISCPPAHLVVQTSV